MLVIGLTAVLSAAGQHLLPWVMNRIRVGHSLCRENCVVHEEESGVALILDKSSRI
jgi:hypothetical protein